MRTIRQSVFETNSSSEHCVTVSEARRTADEFPELVNVDGRNVLEIEAQIDWECGQPGTCTDNLRDILDYLCIMAYNSVPWDCRDEETAKAIRRRNFELLLSCVQQAYQDVGLTAPDELSYYYSDVSGTKYRYPDSRDDNIIWAPDGAGCVRVKIDGDWNNLASGEFADLCQQHPEKVAKCIRTKYPFGVNHNLLFGDFGNLSFEEGYCSEESYGISDLLEKRFTLGFYRT